MRTLLGWIAENRRLFETFIPRYWIRSPAWQTSLVEEIRMGVREADAVMSALESTRCSFDYEKANFYHSKAQDFVERKSAVSRPHVSQRIRYNQRSCILGSEHRD